MKYRDSGPEARPAVRRAAIVGAGLMGVGIGIEYALDGSEVVLLASSPISSQRALERAHTELRWLSDAGALDRERADAATSRLSAATDLATAVQDVEVVVESIEEDLGAKRALFELLDRLAPPEALLASNTSSLPITHIAERAHEPRRILGTHYWNPPHLMPLVELVSGQQTSEDSLDRMERILAAHGKRAIRVRAEVPGFIWNRLQMALFREAAWLVEQGVATPEDVDLSIRLGLGRRYSGIGLFEAADLGGLSTWHGIAQLLFGALSSAKEPEPWLSALVTQGRLGAAVGAGVFDWPDERRDAAKARRDAHLIEWSKKDRGSESEAEPVNARERG